MNTNTMHYFILSAELSTRPGLTNAANTQDLRDKLSRMGYPFTEAEGFYNGSKEVSFVVGCTFADVGKLRQGIMSLAESYGQESIAYVDNESRLTLEYPNGIREYIGKLELDDKALDFYTKINGNKYSAK